MINMRNVNGRNVVVAVALLTLFLVLFSTSLALASGTAAGQSPGVSANPGVIPIGQVNVLHGQKNSRNIKALHVFGTTKAYGDTYGEWTAKWWQWCYSLPVDHHPLFDTADCSAGQSGNVWFLGGSFAPPAELAPGVYVLTVTRSCLVPVGKALFFPVINVETATAEGNGSTDAELRSLAQWYINHTTNLSCTIDGRALQNLQAYRAQSPLFQYGPLPDNNVPQSFGFDTPAGTVSDAVSDGVWLMLEPLSVGSHTINFKGEFLFTQAQDGFDYNFKLDITYNLIIVPGHK